VRGRADGFDGGGLTMEKFRPRKRLKSAHRRDCPKTPLRSYARSLALTPNAEASLMPPSREMLVQAAREWLRGKGVSTIKAAA